MYIKGYYSKTQVMKLLIALSILVVFALPVVAQPGSAQKEINEQVWKPFIKSFGQMDTDKFMSVHSKDVIRATQDDNKLMSYDEYAAATRGWDQGAKNSKRKRDIELRFTHRIASADKALEIGYYKTTNYNADGTSRSFYGKFHVTLRKENGQWKITLDTDTSRDVTEAQFNAAAALE
jgi:ketosteroid isomerase-like protein